MALPKRYDVPAHDSNEYGTPQSSFRNQYQRTLKQSVSCEGIGVHSGQKTSLTFHAASEGTGIVFLRGDLSSQSDDFISAHVRDVVDTSFCTTLANQKGHRARTVEHVLAAFRGCGVHNAIVELHGEEVPIMDGSSAPFVSMIESSGTHTQDAFVPTIVIQKPIRVSYGDSCAMLIPDDHFHLNMTFNAGTRLNNLSWTLDFDPNDTSFRDHLASARTFGFYEDAEKLWAAGLAQGTSLDNTIVFQDGALLNKAGLRFQDELVRHKVLDALGDLALLGHNIKGKFIGVNSGHTLHFKLMQALLSDDTAYELHH